MNETRTTSSVTRRPHHRGGRIHGHRSGSTAEATSNPSESPVEPGMYESVDIEWGDDYNVVGAADRSSPFQVTTESPVGRVLPVRDGRDQTHTFLASAASRLNTDTVGLAGSASHRLTGSSGVGQLTMTSCVTASTGVNSLSVALGSTFGAFLALGVIVAFVLAAKWQHVRRTRKLHTQLLQRLSDSNDSLMLAAAGLDGDIMMTAIAGDMALQRVCFANGDGCDSGVIVVGGDSGDAMEVASSMSAADSSHHHQRHNHRVTMNGDIEMRRFHRASVGGDGTGNGYVDGKNGEYDDAVDVYYDDDNPDGDDDGSLSSDFSADIILHAGTDCPPSDVGIADGGTIGSKLVLDSATCAGSFILANDDPTGRTYSLLVPLSAVGVQPLLSSAASGRRGGSDTLIASGANIAGLQLVTIAGGGDGGGGGRGSGGGVAVSGPTTGVGQSIVRLKLRKHATVDYSSIADGDGDYYDRRGSTSTVEPARLAASSTATPAAAAFRGMRPPLERHNVVINVQSATPTSTMAGDAATASGEYGAAAAAERTLPDDFGLSDGRRTDCEPNENSRQEAGERAFDQQQEQQFQEQPRLTEAETPSIPNESTMKRSTSSGW